MSAHDNHVYAVQKAIQDAEAMLIEAQTFHSLMMTCEASVRMAVGDEPKQIFAADAAAMMRMLTERTAETKQMIQGVQNQLQNYLNVI